MIQKIINQVNSTLLYNTSKLDIYDEISISILIIDLENKTLIIDKNEYNISFTSYDAVLFIRYCIYSFKKISNIKITFNSLDEPLVLGIDDKVETSRFGSVKYPKYNKDQLVNINSVLSHTNLNNFFEIVELLTYLTSLNNITLNWYLSNNLSNTKILEKFNNSHAIKYYSK